MMRDQIRGAFYGWWIVAASFLILLVTVGIGLYAPPVFLVPLENHFGWSRAAITGGGGLAALVAGMTSPFAGALIHRYGARKVMTAGALVMGCAFGSIGLIQSLWHLYALNVIAALGIACVAWIPNQTLISNWFDRKRGLAMGITLAGIGFGGFAMASLAGILIVQIGWRLAFVSLGCLVLLLVVTVVLVVVRSRPADLGLLPDGDPVDPQSPLMAESGEAQEAMGLDLSESIRTSAFWILSAVHLLWTFGSMSIVGHLAAFLSDQGFETRIAAGSLGGAILISVLGRVIFGLFSDRYSKRVIMSAAMALQALAVVCLFSQHSLAALAAFLFLFGMGLGGGAVLIPLLVGELFGLRAFGKILGMVMISATLGGAAGPVATGRIFDLMGSYDLAFILHIVSMGAAAVAIHFLRRPRQAEARIIGTKTSFSEGT
jgi:MFS family permease